MIENLKGMFVITISPLTQSVDIQEQTGAKLKDVPDIMIVASKKKSDANKHKRNLMKRFKLKKSGGNIVNFTDMIELTTNY